MGSKLNNASTTLEDLDEVDRKIIQYLQKNGRESFTKMSEEMGIPTSTVRDRTNRLLDNDILRIMGLLNPLKARERVMANIGIKLSSGDHERITAEISQFDEVSYLVVCAGSFDLMVEVVCRDHTHLLELTTALKNISGVHSTETFIYYKIVKEVLTWGVAHNWGKVA
ncbi:MAG: Lrp/AsnC family transcriptional regulator [Chloroflexota bacterium]